MIRKQCIFCKIANKEIPSKIIYENDNFFSVPDANPIIKGHCLVISKQHFENVLDMPASLGRELLECIKKTSMILMKNEKADGFNIVNNNFDSAGQVVKHIHFHIIPRKKNDGKVFDLWDKK
jgi:histidine triad (HIT) family protein